MVAEPGSQERIQQRIDEESVDELRRSSRTQSNPAANLKLISLALSGKCVDFSKIISMIDEMVILRERIQERIVEVIVDVCVQRLTEEITEVVKLSLQDLVQNLVQKCTVKQTVDTTVLQILEEIVEVIQPIQQGRISESIAERLVDIPARMNPTDKLAMEMTHDLQIPQEQYIDKTVDVPAMTQGRVHTIQPVQKGPQTQVLDRVLDDTVVKQRHVSLRSMPQEQIRERIFEEIMQVAVSRVMEETIEELKPIPQERVQNNTAEQIVECTRSSADTGVRQASISETHVGSCSVLNATHSLTSGCPVSRPSMNETMQKTVEVPPIQFIDKTVDVPVVMRRQIPVVQNVQKTVEVPQVHVSSPSVDDMMHSTFSSSKDTVMDVPVIMQRQVPAVQVVRKTVEVPQTQFIDGVVDTPVVQQRQIPTVPTVQKTMGNPQAQFLDEVADTPVVAQHQVDTAQNLRADKAVIKKNHVKKCLDMFAEIAGKRDDQKKFSEEFGKGRKKIENGMEDGCVVVVDMPDAAEHRHKVMQRQDPHVQSTQKTVEVPRVQFIDRVVDDPAVMQREAFNIEARELTEDEPVGAKQQKSERPLSPKKRRPPVETESGFQSGEPFDLDAESNHERFKDLVLPSSQSCLCVSIASSDEGGDEDGARKYRGMDRGEEKRKEGNRRRGAWPLATKRRKCSSNKQRPEVSSKGENTGVRKTRLTRKAWEASWSKWRQTWGPVAHTPRPRWTRSGPKSCTRSVRWSSSWCNGKENSTSRRTWPPEGWKGWKERAPS